MGLEENKTLYRRFIQEIFNEGRFEKLDDFLAADYVYRDAPPGTPPGGEGIKQIVTMVRTAFPDLEISFEDQVAEGDKVASRTMMRGTHQGPFGEPAPTGKAIAVPGLTIVRIANGRIAESWVKNDMLSLFAQLGAPPPGKK